MGLLQIIQTLSPRAFLICSKVILPPFLSKTFSTQIRTQFSGFITIITIVHAFTPAQNSPSIRVLQDILPISQVLPHTSHFQVSSCLLALIKIEFTKADSFSLAFLAADSIHNNTFMSSVKVFPTFPIPSKHKPPINNFIIIL